MYVEEGWGHITALFHPAALFEVICSFVSHLNCASVLSNHTMCTLFKVMGTFLFDYQFHIYFRVFPCADGTNKM